MLKSSLTKEESRRPMQESQRTERARCNSGPAAPNMGTEFAGPRGSCAQGRSSSTKARNRSGTPTTNGTEANLAERNNGSSWGREGRSSAKSRTHLSIPVYRSGNEAEDRTVCRICLSGDGAQLRRFCRCRGTMGLCHHDCLVTWVRQQNAEHCELCQGPFVMTKTVPPLWQWKIPPMESETIVDTVFCAICYCLAAGLLALQYFLIASKMVVPINLVVLFSSPLNFAILLALGVTIAALEMWSFLRPLWLALRTANTIIAIKPRSKCKGVKRSQTSQRGSDDMDFTSERSGTLAVQDSQRSVSRGQTSQRGWDDMDSTSERSGTLAVQDSQRSVSRGKTDN